MSSREREERELGAPGPRLFGVSKELEESAAGIRMGLSGSAAQEVKGTGAWVVSEVWGPWKRFRVRSSKHDRGEDYGRPEGGAQPLSHGFSVCVCVPRRPPAGQFAVPGGGHSCQPGRQAALGGLSLAEEARQRASSCSPFLFLRQAGRVTLIGVRLRVEHIAKGTTRLCHFSHSSNQRGWKRNREVPRTGTLGFMEARLPRTVFFRFTSPLLPESSVGMEGK